MESIMAESLPLIRSHERIDFKRCPKKWFWKWRKGLMPKAITFGALELGIWMHGALGEWYGTGLRRAEASLRQLFSEIASDAMVRAAAAGAPSYVLDDAEELAALGETMAQGYQDHYEQDAGINVLATEIPLEFSIGDSDTKEIVAMHRLKPDLVYADRSGDIWLMEHKTAAQVRTEHLVIDDQARPYGVMAERALRNTGVIGKGDRFKGVMYNFLRKALPDERETDATGKALNKDGSVSKRQPAPNFVRHPVTLTRDAKVMALRRLQSEVYLITALTQALRDKKIAPIDLPKTPHNSCPKFCQYFTMCVAEEQGSDIRDMQRNMYTIQNPYDYGDTTDEPVSFEMG